MRLDFSFFPEASVTSMKKSSNHYSLSIKASPVVIARRPHPIPSRTRKLSSLAPMVLHDFLCGRVGRRRVFSKSPHPRFERRLRAFSFWASATDSHRPSSPYLKVRPRGPSLRVSQLTQNLSPHYGVETIPVASGRLASTSILRNTY